MAYKQSRFLNLMIGDGKMYLYEILISSYQKVLLQKSTAVYTIRAVDECQTEQR